MAAKLVERAKADRDEVKQEARREAIELLQGITRAAYRWLHAAKGETERAEARTLLHEVSAFTPILYERSAPLKLILEHLLLVIPTSSGRREFDGFDAFWYKVKTPVITYMAAKPTKKANSKAPAKRSASKRAPQRASKPASVVKLGFDSAKLVKQLLEEVPERAREVLTYRFGLGSSADRETLEAIGERWGITRERVRQIEAAGLDAIRGSKSFKNAQPSFDELSSHVRSLGAVVEEEELLSGLASDEKARNRYRFLLVAGSAFFRERETDDFYARWHVDQPTAAIVP